MQVEITQGGNALQTIHHAGQDYVVARITKKKRGGNKYAIRVHNESAQRRMAVISVDGINVLDGETAGVDGPGYVLDPFEILDIPGWRRSDDKVASFEFKDQDDSYSVQTDRGTSNVGIIGVAVFDEKAPQYTPPPQIVIHQFPSNGHPAGCRCAGCCIWPMSWTYCMPGQFGGEEASQDILSMTASVKPNEPTKSPLRRSKAIQDVGTGYGKEVGFSTTSTSFEKSTAEPVRILLLRYAAKDRLVSWGVPVKLPKPSPAPDPFPASRMAVPAPPGYQG